MKTVAAMMLVLSLAGAARGRAEAGCVPPWPVPSSPVARAVGAVDAMVAMDESPATRVLAWRLARALKVHEAALDAAKVELPAAVAKLAGEPEPKAAPIVDADLALAAERGRPVLAAAMDWRPGAHGEFDMPPKLGVALASAIASASPSAALAVEAAARLLDRAVPGEPGGPIPDPAVPASTAAEAAMHALGRVGANAADAPRDADEAAAAAEALGVAERYLWAAALASGEPVTREAPAKGLDALRSRVAEGGKGEAGRRLLRRLDALEGRLDALVLPIEQYARLSRLAERLITLVNTENREDLREAATQAAAKRLAASEPMRAILGGPDARRLEFLGAGRPYRAGEELVLPVRFLVTDAAGVTSVRVAELPVGGSKESPRLGLPQGATSESDR